MERNIEGYTNYYITNDGRVYSFNQNKWKKIHIHRGRAMIKLSDGHGNMKNRSISRLVAKAYVPNPENKPYVLHLDNNPLNNPFSNLKWGTQAENMQQMARDGRSTKGRVRERGELSVASKLTNRQRRRILRMLDKGVKQIHLANKFGVHRKTLEHLQKKRAWYGL